MMETQNWDYTGDTVPMTTAKVGMKETSVDSCVKVEWRRNHSSKVDIRQKETAAPATLNQIGEEVTAWMERECTLLSKLYLYFKDI